MPSRSFILADGLWMRRFGASIIDRRIVLNGVPHEVIGVIALGADRRMILRMVLIGGLRIAAAGLAIGVLGALALTHAARRLLGEGLAAASAMQKIAVMRAFMVSSVRHRRTR